MLGFIVQLYFFQDLHRLQLNIIYNIIQDFSQFLSHLGKSSYNSLLSVPFAAQL